MFLLINVMNIFASTQTLLEQVLISKQHFSNVLPARYQQGKVYVLDISPANKDFAKIDIYSTPALVAHSQKVRKESGADLVVGRYLEDRNIYKRGEHYGNGEEVRSVHLGQDLMVPANTPVYSPLAAKVHSFKDNNQKADYGPTIILEHKLRGVTFYTLYGHLSRESLNGLQKGQVITAGQRIAWVGTPEVNGGWPEHLHFQIIDNMRGNMGNYIGVSAPSQVAKYSAQCPNPNLILHIKALS